MQNALVPTVHEMRATYPAIPAAPLTPQQETFLYHQLLGATVAKSRAVAGASASDVDAWLEDENFLKVRSFYEKRNQQHYEITRETITALLMESHRKAASSTEEVTALREVIKVHGLYKQTGEGQNNVTINVNTVDRLEDAQLLQMAGMDDAAIRPVERVKDTPEGLPDDSS